MFYNNIESCVLNNGWLSNFFKLQRGVRQGCPLSPYLFILSVEVLGKAIRANTSIKGITVNNTEIKLSQYTDDTTLILNGNQNSLSAAIETIENFGNSSGLKLNDKKTEALWIGSVVGKREKFSPKKNFKWPENRVKVLGAWISTHFKTQLYRKGEQDKKYSELLGIPTINFNRQNSGYQQPSLISTHLHFNTISDKPEVYQ